MRILQNLRSDGLTRGLTSVAWRHHHHRSDLPDRDRGHRPGPEAESDRSPNRGGAQTIAISKIKQVTSNGDGRSDARPNHRAAPPHVSAVTIQQILTAYLDKGVSGNSGVSSSIPPSRPTRRVWLHRPKSFNLCEPRCATRTDQHLQSTFGSLSLAMQTSSISSGFNASLSAALSKSIRTDVAANREAGTLFRVSPGGSCGRSAGLPLEDGRTANHAPRSVRPDPRPATS
jgi:hypothetical protein